mmetsp:Transcript_13237/g.35136  ORF Transcript_13237/g.35136 Transcript_13237/m.35136 type:complete len:212 (+) Transcript_13237:1260-1895(+)
MKCRAPIFRLAQCWRRLACDEEDNAHRRVAPPRWLALAKLDERDAERPQVNRAAVGTLLHHLGSHPVGRANEGTSSWCSCGHECRCSKVRKSHAAVASQQNVSALQVAMYDPVRMQVRKTVQTCARDVCNERLAVVLRAERSSLAAHQREHRTTGAELHENPHGWICFRPCRSSIRVVTGNFPAARKARRRLRHILAYAEAAHDVPVPRRA